MQSVNEAVNSFNKILREVADPLFEKHVVFSNNASFSPTSCVKHAEWFDFECEQSKQRYLEALRVFNRSHTMLSRQHFCDCKNQYKSFIRKKKRSLELKKLEGLEKLRHRKPREFWKYFTQNKSNINSSSSIPLDSFYDHFSNLENEPFRTVNEDVESFCENNVFNGNIDNDFNEELDYPITEGEILSTIKQLKRNKAYGIDNLLNEYFIEGGDILSPYLCKLFNAVLDLGCFPDVWSKGIIISLFKRGDKKNVANYRGITLLFVKNFYYNNK